MKILNLYAGIGGNRKLWGDEHEVTAIENNKEIAEVYKKLFPKDKVIIKDAHKFLLQHYKEYDFIWSSPPCPSHSILNRTGRFKKARYPDFKLYEEIIFLKHNFKGKWVVENVKPYYEPLIKPYFAGRHCFWSNFHVANFKIRSPKTLTSMTKEDLMKWLDMYIKKNIYIKPNHCERQILRNCVHPKLGLHVFNCAFKEIQQILTKSEVKHLEVTKD